MYQGKLNKARARRVGRRHPDRLRQVADRRSHVRPGRAGQVQDVIRRIFDEFDRRGTVHGVLRSLIARRRPAAQQVASQSGPDRGRLDWRTPCRETVRHVLRHPMYAGPPTATGSGRRRARRQIPAARGAAGGAGLAPEDCLVFLKDRFPAYITYERFEANQRGLAANRSRAESPAAVRRRQRLAGRRGQVRAVREADVRAVRAGRIGGRPVHLQYPADPTTGCRCVQAGHGGRGRGLVGRAGPRRCLQPAALEASFSRGGGGRAGGGGTACGTGSSGWSGRREGRGGLGLPASIRRVSRRTGWWPGRWSAAGRRRCRRSGRWRRTSTASSGRSHGSPLAAAGLRAHPSAGRGSAGRCGGPPDDGKPADRRQVVRLLVDRVVLTVLDPGDDRVAVRVEWAGGAVVRERTDPIGLCRDIGISNHGPPSRPGWRKLRTSAGRRRRRSRRRSSIGRDSGRRSGRPGSRPGWWRALAARARVGGSPASRALCRRRPPRSCPLGRVVVARPGSGRWASRRTRCTAGGGEWLAPPRQVKAVGGGPWAVWGGRVPN